MQELIYDFTLVRIYCELVWLKIRTVSLFSLPYWILICAPVWDTCKSIFTALHKQFYIMD